MSSVQYKGQRYQIPPSHHSLKSLSSIRRAACKKFSLSNYQEWTLSAPGKGIISNLSQTMKEANIARRTVLKLIPNVNPSSSSNNSNSNSSSNLNKNPYATAAAKKQQNIKDKHSGSLAQLRKQHSSKNARNGNNNNNNNNSSNNKHESGNIKWTLMVQIMGTGQNNRHKITVSSNTTLWDLLKAIEINKDNRANLTNRKANENGKEGHYQPNITFLNQTVLLLDTCLIQNI